MGTDYSPIRSIRTKNFNCIGDVTIDFKDSPIIALVGDNDAGKSSLIDAFGVLAYHANERNQKNNIRDGTRGFGEIVELVDNTVITRIKTEAHNNYSVVYPDGEKWETNKIEPGGGVPLVVQDVMGCVRDEETKEYLHIRTYRDQLLFINTSSGVNYKVMYSALKAEHISKAIKLGTDHINKINAMKKKNEIVLDTLINSYNSIKIYDTKPLEGIEKRVDTRIKAIKLLEQALEIKNNIEVNRDKLGVYQQILDANLTDIDIRLTGKIIDASDTSERYKVSKKALDVYRGLNDSKVINGDGLIKLEQMSKLSKSIDKLKIKYNRVKLVEGIKDIDISALEKLRSASSKIDRIIEKNKYLSKYMGIEKTEEVEVDVFKKLSVVRDRTNELKDSTDKLNGIKENIDRLTREIKDSGIKMAVCGNCGEDVYVE